MQVDDSIQRTALFDFEEVLRQGPMRSAALLRNLTEERYYTKGWALKWLYAFLRSGAIWMDGNGLINLSEVVTRNGQHLLEIH